MLPDEVEPPDLVCPDADTLAAFSRGDLSLHSLEELASHVSTCPTCSEVLTAVTDDDPLVLDLRRCLRGTPPVHRPRMSRPSDSGAPPGGRVVHPSGAGLPRQLGKYQLIEVIGQGAMGVVYKARQAGLNRIVAVKVSRLGLLWSSEASARLRTECEAIARLHHDNIVQVHEFAEADGVPFFSMEYLPGGTLAAHLATGPIPHREAAALVRALAEAVHYAHEHNVLHRDLKPANVLLGADGSVRLTDFGLAKLMDIETGQTGGDAVIGTAGYMSPEQAAGRSRDVGPAADVYALGAILYETLTGRPPFQAATKLATMDLVRNCPVAPPSSLRPEVPADLDAICLKCLEKAPSDRYLSARGLADELECWLTGRPTRARPPGWAARNRRRLRQAGGAIAVGMAVAGGLAAVDRLDPERPRRMLEADLDHGRTVTLVGATGPPAYYRVRRGDERTKVSTAEDGTFTVHSWTFALVELVPDPRRDRFRFRASVRHRNSDIGGYVGAYVAGRACPGPAADNFLLVQLSFNDVRTASDTAPPHLLPRLRAPGENRVQLGLHVIGAGSGGRGWERRVEFPTRTSFAVGGVSNETWRRLEAVVTPAGVAALWDDFPAGEASVGEVTGQLTETLADLGRQDPQDEYVKLADPNFCPRGSVGLIVSRGSASFRSVELLPIEDE